MTSLFFAAALLLDSGKTPDQKPIAPVPETDLRGIYRSVSVLPDNTKMVQAVTVVKKGNVHIFLYGAGPRASIGVGLRTGDTISVGWTQEGKDELSRGVTVYTIHGRTLRGRWVMLPSGGQIMTETLTWLGNLDE